MNVAATRPTSQRGTGGSSYEPGKPNNPRATNSSPCPESPTNAMHCSCWWWWCWFDSLVAEVVSLLLRKSSDGGDDGSLGAGNDDGNFEGLIHCHACEVASA
eukprot:CAMPEP_0171749118 /NCGR_PEP_ID=MMETSP0991-20121206/40536_1 /TAXON_ID=483369 /ORGANISM="non described non described, Strain CCMP2098" /LENGTH=101 /DNA_ID=CAMNT_0012349661 /DNA_START=226 /DNA_END=528 /DNA_ORIENTATION=+